MAVLLNVQSSPNLSGSGSRAVSRAFVERFVSVDPDAEVIDLDLAQAPLAPINEHHLGAFFAPPAAHSAESAAALRVSDDLIEQVVRADVLLLGTPMHNLGISATMKAWIDNIVRIGRTFRYDDRGAVVGLMPPKKVVIVMASGGIYSDGPMRDLDFASRYLEGIFRFLGMTDIEVIHVEGLSMGGEMASRGMARAIARAETIAEGRVQAFA
jgi:FMN-dependent NADH-azoreductase